MPKLARIAAPVAMLAVMSIGRLLPAIDRHQQPRPGAATAGGPATISIPSIRVKARIGGWRFGVPQSGTSISGFQATSHR